MEQTLALFLAGVVAVPLLQLLKRYTKLSGVPMVWIAFLSSMVIAVVTLVILGKAAGLFSDPFTFFGSSGIVMTLATLVYRSIKEKLNLS